LKTTVK